MPPKKNLSRGCLSNWCDADAEISKRICRPYGGGGGGGGGGRHNKTDGGAV